MQDPVSCPCGRWEWRNISVSTALTAREETCPRCRDRFLLVYRTHEFLGAVPLDGQDLGSFRDALESMDGLSPGELEVLTLTAKLGLREAS